MRRQHQSWLLLLCWLSAAASIPESCLAQCTEDDKAKCCCESGLAFPQFDTTPGLPMGSRAFLYCVLLLWCFMGVAIVADVFMASIEVITSKTKTASDKEGNSLTVKVWNDTVANLSLMALGSSAPEILLSIIEIVGNNFKSGELGPSTIVGSAAFNLLVITGICVMAVTETDGEKDKPKVIKQMDVFKITAFFSVFAYLWLVIILMAWTPNVVTLVEALITFLFFPSLLGLAYAADIGMFSRRNKVSPDDEGGPTPHIIGIANEKGELQFRAHDVSELLRNAKGADGPLNEEDLVKIAEYQMHKGMGSSRARYRINATRSLTGGHRVKKDPPPIPEELATAEGEEFAVQVAFEAKQYSVKEDEKYLEVGVYCTGHKNLGTQYVAYESKDETAKAGEDYVAVKGVLKFEATENHKTFSVSVIDDIEWEPDEHFILGLSAVSSSKEPGPIDWDNSTRVTIVNVTAPGVLQFARGMYNVAEMKGEVVVDIIRERGSTGEVSCAVATRDGTAIATKDYTAITEKVTFAHGETQKQMRIEIINDNSYEKDENFTIQLMEPQGTVQVEGVGVTLHETLHTTTVTITSDDETKELLDKVASLLNMNLDAYKVGSNSWGEQFQKALSVEGDGGKPSAGDYVMHALTVFWKVLFAMIPPTVFMGGWLCFCVALIFIGGLTLIIGDVASVFGCSIQFPDAITAITFVALGTSLPDTFASKAAAQGDDYADASVGNVTGSNSVNVFLGLGTPWLIAAIYWESQGLVFEVDSGSLGWSVIVFCACACTCLGMLVVRRYTVGGELGGANPTRTACGVFSISLWFLYILLSVLEIIGMIDGI